MKPGDLYFRLTVERNGFTVSATFRPGEEDLRRLLADSAPATGAAADEDAFADQLLARLSGQAHPLLSECLDALRVEVLAAYVGLLREHTPAIVARPRKPGKEGGKK